MTVENSALRAQNGKLKKRVLELERLVYVDDLTGTYNRRWMADHAHSVDKDPHGYLFIDVDDFKRVNDLLGHDIGDEILCEIAEYLVGITRSGRDGRRADAIRWGGDEFLIRCSSPGASMVLSERIKGFVTIKHGTAVTITVGAGATVEEAEENMRRAKARKGCGR